MKRIEKIHINNFKFFPDCEPIKIEGKNILLYGENGSGKSSIYWALYTLLECSEKNDPSKIRKYFEKSNKESLVNIYTAVDQNGICNSFIKFELNDNSVFEVSYQNTDININQDAKESLLASDFLNYKLLQRSHNFRHSQEIDMFPMFEDHILSYVQFSPVNWHDTNGVVIQLTNASAIWKIAKQGPEKKYPNKQGKNSYPTKKSHSNAHKEFNDLCKGFNASIKLLIDKINNSANNILKNKLGYNITFHLELVLKQKEKLTIASYNAPKYEIKLIIDDFNGKGAIIKPQSFLNEARLSALALSIRLAILEERLPDATIKILVLDDLMISLDMTNRDKVSSIILNDYAWYSDDTGNDHGHQTFILTHDRSLFTFIKNDIANLSPIKKDTWKLIEIYVDDKDENDPLSYEKPKVLDYENEFRLAYNHYKNHDYPSAANYLRKHCEKVLTDYLPEYYWKSIKEEKSNFKSPLDSIINSGILFWESFGIDNQKYKKLRKYVSILLNPLSHADVGVERYKKEIQDVINLLTESENLHKTNSWKVILSGGEFIEIRLVDSSRNLNCFTYELNTSFYEIMTDSGKHLSTFNSRLIHYKLIDINNNIINEGDFDGKSNEMKKNYDICLIKNCLIGSANWKDDLYKIDGTKLL